jgi:hypothetical protein
MLLVPVRVAVIVLIVAPRSSLLDRTTAHHGHLSSQAVFFWIRNLVFRALSLFA